MRPRDYIRALLQAARADWITSAILTGMAIFLTIGVAIK